MATERNIDDILSEIRKKREQKESDSPKKSESTIDEILKNIGIETEDKNNNAPVAVKKEAVADVSAPVISEVPIVEEQKEVTQKIDEDKIEDSFTQSKATYKEEKPTEKPTMKTVELTVNLPKRLVKTAELERQKIEEERERQIKEENRLREERIQREERERAKRLQEEQERAERLSKESENKQADVSPIIAAYVKNTEKIDDAKGDERPVVTTSREFITNYFNSVKNGSKISEEETIEKIIDFKEKQLSGEFDTKAIKKAIAEEFSPEIADESLDSYEDSENTTSIDIASSIGAVVSSTIASKDVEDAQEELSLNTEESKTDTALSSDEEIEIQEVEPVVEHDIAKEAVENFNADSGEFIAVEDFEAFKDTMEINVDKLANEDFERYQQNLIELQKQAEESGEDEEEYDDPVSKDNIKRDIKALINSLSFRFFITLIPTIALVYIDFAQILMLPILDSLLAKNDPLVYIFSTSILTLLILVTNFLTITKGILGIRKPNSDTPIAILAVVSAIATAIVFFNTGYLQDSSVQLFNSVVAVSFLLNLQGKIFMARRIERSFKFISTEDEKYSCNLIADKTISNMVDEETDNQGSVVATHIKSKFLHKFLKNSYSQDPMDRLMPTITILSALAALFAIAISFALRLPMISILTTAIAAFAFTVPVCSTIVSNYPIYKTNKKLFRWGAVVTGYLAAENADKADVIACTDNDILPHGSITLGGIKPFADNRIDKIILYAASVFIKIGSSLAPLFLDIIDNELTMLYKIESLEVSKGGAIEAFADDKRIVIGTRKQLGDCGLFAPSKDFEERFIKESCQTAFYIAINGEIAAMFVLNFEVREDIKQSVESLVNSGFKVVVSNKNQNIDENMLKEVLGVSQGVYLASDNLKDKFDEVFADAGQSAEASIAHKGSFESFAQALLGVIRMRFTVLMGSYCQLVAVIVGAVISLLLTATSSITDLTAAAAMIYQIIWVTLLGLFSAFRK